MALGVPVTFMALEGFEHWCNSVQHYEDFDRKGNTKAT